MKKLLLTLALLLTAALSVLASDHAVTISRGEGLYEDGTGVYYCIKDGVMMTFTGGLDNDNFLLEMHEKIFEIRSANYIIKKVVFHCVDNALENDFNSFYWGPTTISVVNNFTYPGQLGQYEVVNDGYDGVWTGQTSAIQFKTKGFPVRFGSVDIIYEKLDGDIFDLVTTTDQIVEGKTYIIVSRYYDKVMKFKKTDDLTFPATDIVEWMNDGKTKVKVDGNACLFKMEGVNNDTLRTSNKYEKAAWLNTLNGYIRSQNYNLITRTSPNDYCRAHMYISANENNLLLKFNDMSSGGNTYTVRYDYDNAEFKVLNYNSDSQQRVWLYKLAESFQVTTECIPEEGGVIELTGGVVEGTSQQYETVTFTVTENSGYELTSIETFCNNVSNIVTPTQLSEVENADGTKTVTYSFEMPADDVKIVANFTLIPDVDTYRVTTECVPADGGVITLTGGVVEGVSQEDETVTFTVTENSGYSLTSVNLNCADATISVTPTQLSTVENADGTKTVTYSFEMPACDMHIQAYFELIPVAYNVTTECIPAEGGVIELTEGVENGTSMEGELVKFTVTENSGYSLTAVNVICADETITVTPTPLPNGAKAVNYSFEMPACDVKIQAIFTEDPILGPYRVTAECDPEVAGEIVFNSGVVSGTSDENVTVSFTVVETIGYTFHEIDADGDDINCEVILNMVDVSVDEQGRNIVTYTFTMPACNVHIIAGFLTGINTGVKEVAPQRAVQGVEYVNVAGMKSDKPFDGINIVVTRYSDGSVETKKVKF